LSKGTIGTFAGAALGFVIGGPAGAQVGALLGGAIGSSFDTIKGRQVGEMSSPRAQEGEPIPLVFGTARVRGRLMSTGEPVIRKEKEGGKGGPKVENETAYLSYSILICESSELRDSTVAAVVKVIQNNKTVYDVTPNPEISAAESAKWKANKTFYFGGEAQGVDPTEEMIHGVGNVPAYRGWCRMVVDDEDVTQHGGSIPTYEFVVSACGVEDAVPPDAIACGLETTFEGGESFPSEFTVNLGSGLGTVTFDYLTGNIPDKFVVTLDGVEVINTGYVGDPDYVIAFYGKPAQEALDDFMIAEGLPTEAINMFNPAYTPGLGLDDNPGTMQTSFNKVSTSSVATVRVYAPLEGTGWYFRLNCPDGTVIYAGDEIPDAPGYYIDPVTGATDGPSLGVALMCGITLQEIVDRLDDRAGIPTANRDSDDLADIDVPGYAIDQFMTVAEAKEPLRQVYFFDCPEWDDAIRYRLRGKPTDFTVDPDDLILGEDAVEKGVRGQTVEFPKKIHVQYIDPATGYKPMKQTAERISPDIRVKGEVVIGANITLEADTAKQAADIAMKSLWAEREDSREIALPMDYWADAVAAHTYTLDGRRFRITDLKMEAGAIYIQSVYDRASAYSSEAVGTVGPTPTGPQPTIVGPSIVAVLNMPVFRDEFDKPGVSWAARGYPDTAWQGTRLQVQRGATWVTLGDITDPCNIGALLSDFPAHDGDVDETNTLHIQMPDDMDSVTTEAWYAEGNPLAIQYADGTVEVVQPRDVVEVAPGEYECTNIIRGRLDTVRGLHEEGAKVVFLDAYVGFAQLSAADLGQTLTFRAYSLGTNPDAAPTFTLTLATMESQREWQPYNVEWTTDGNCETLVTFIGRARLGTDASPVQSQYFKGWRVDFTVPGIGTRSRMTQEESFLYTQAMQTEDFGSIFCGGFEPVTVTAINEYTGADGGGGDGLPDGTGTPNTGDPMTDPDFSAEWKEQGSIPDWPAGEAFFIKGDGSGGFVFKGGTTSQVNVGGLTAGVTAVNLGTSAVGTNGFWAKGIALSAGTENADARLISDLSNAEPHAGNITDSITWGAKPTYAFDNWLNAGEAYGVGMPATTPPGTTMEALGLGGFIESRAEFTSGKINVECEADGITDADRTLLGVVVAEAATPDDPGTIVSQWMRSLPSDDIYTMRVNADVSPATIEIETSGGVVIWSGSITLPVGKVFRIRRGSQERGVKLRMNYGNQSWSNAVDVGYGGLPNMATVVPVQWNGRTNKTYQLSSNGRYGPVTDAGHILTAGGVGLLLGSFGLSSGAKRVRFFDDTVTEKQRVGLCLSTQTGQLGSTGTSIGYRNANRNDRFHRLYWTWGGTSDYAPLPVGFDTNQAGLLASRPADVVFAPDFAAGTIEVWIAEQGPDNVMKDLRLWTTITGMPAGTYYPALYADNSGAASLYYNADEPAGHDDWTITV